MGRRGKIDKAEQKLREALEILKALGLPRQQQNERSALTLLSLLSLRPGDPWDKAGGKLFMSVTPK